MKILVSGGTGYIGSHTCVELLNKGYDVVAFDNLYNSKIDVVDRVEKITGKKLIFYKADMLDKESMRPIFEEHKFDAVIHFCCTQSRWRIRSEAAGLLQEQYFRFIEFMRTDE